MKKMKKNLYLFSPHTQDFFIKKEGQAYSRAHMVERRLRQLTHKADIQYNLTHESIQTYIADITSEIKKFLSTIEDKQVIKTVRKTLTRKTYPFSDLTPLMDHLNHAFIVTDQLLVLILTAAYCHVFDHKRTVYSLTDKLNARFSRLIAAIQHLPFNTKPKTTVSTFLWRTSVDTKPIIAGKSGIEHTFSLISTSLKEASHDSVQ